MAEEKDLQIIKQLLDMAENNIRQAKSLLFSSEIGKKARNLDVNEESHTIEGIFDGEGMVGSDKKKYPIPVNYASKSKLVFGDLLKLTVLNDGSFLFKQIGPVERKKLVGQLVSVADGKYEVDVEGKNYRVLSASVTYFKASEGDKVTIILPEEGESEWAAIENVLDIKE